LAVIRHFLELTDYSPAVLRGLLAQALSWKQARAQGHPTPQLLAGKQVALLFEKPSTRTRVSFDVGVRELGGHSLVLASQELQMGRGETVADTARVLSRYVDAIMLRCYAPATLQTLAAYASVPVINGLTDDSHPCQVLADAMTLQEHYDTLEGRICAWVGPCTNVLHSWIQLAGMLGIVLRIATPEALRPPSWAAAYPHVVWETSPRAAVDGAHCVMTDTWVSMGQQDTEVATALLGPYQVTPDMMAAAAPCAGGALPPPPPAWRADHPARPACPARAAWHAPR
jgi:ornithine carbamoyltransferase